MTVCSFCAEPIKEAARVCPFCCSAQTRLAYWWPYIGAGASVAAMLTIVGLACVWLFPEAFHAEGRRFAPYRAQLVVSRTSLKRDPMKLEFGLSGYVTNTGHYPWRVQELEVRLMDGEHKLVDVRHSEVSEMFVVQPHQESAFRVDLGTLVFTNADINVTVRVQEATDGNLPAKTD
jgi:hypothetical protein